MAEKNNTERVTICLNRDIQSHAEILEWMEAFDKTTNKNRNRAIARQIITLLHGHVVKVKKKTGKLKKERKIDVSSQDAALKKDLVPVATPLAIKDGVVSDKQMTKITPSKWSAPPETRNKGSSKLTSTMKKMSFDDD